MNAQFKIGLAVIVGAALGAGAVQVLHAQVKPKAYIVTESEVIDAAALASFSPQARTANQAAGGLPVARPGGKIVALVGEPPKRIGISEWESLEKAQAYQNSDAFKKLAPQRDKAVKIIRSYVIEASAN